MEDSGVFGPDIIVIMSWPKLHDDEDNAQQTWETLFQVDQDILATSLLCLFPTNFSLDFHSKTLAHKPGPWQEKQGKPLQPETWLLPVVPGSSKTKGSRHIVDSALLPEQALDIGEFNLAFIVFTATSQPL